MRSIFSFVFISMAIMLGSIQVFGLGGSPIAFVRVQYSPSPIPSTSYVPIYNPTVGLITHITDTDTSTQVMALSFAASCAALSTSANTIVIPAGGIGLINLDIPAGVCVGLKALSGTANTGEVDINFFR